MRKKRDEYYVSLMLSYATVNGQEEELYKLRVELADEKEKVAGTLVPKSDLERELTMLQQQLMEPMRKTLWVEESEREAELELELVAERNELEEVQRGEKGEFSAFSSIWQFN